MVKDRYSNEIEYRLRVLKTQLEVANILVPNNLEKITLDYFSRRRDIAQHAGVHYNDISPYTNPANFVRQIIKGVITQGSHTKEEISLKLGKDEIKEIIYNQLKENEADAIYARCFRNQKVECYNSLLKLFVAPEFFDCCKRRFESDSERIERLKYRKQK